MNKNEFPGGAEIAKRTDTGKLEKATTPGLMWLNATDPRTFTPQTFRDGGMSRMLFATPDQIVVNVTRSIGKCLDGARLVQDEIQSTLAHKVTQFNYELNEQDEPTHYPNTQTFNPAMQDCIDLITPLVHQKGSKIVATTRMGEREASFVSDGTQWVDVRLLEEQREIGGTDTLPSSSSQLHLE